MKAGWQTNTLGELCDFQRGLTYKKGDEVDLSENIVLRATNIDLRTNLLDVSELKYISDEVTVPDSKKVKKDSLIICTASGSKSHLGKVAFIDEDYRYAFGGFMGMITPKTRLVPKYLFHLMTSPAYKDFIGELADGANINNLTFDQLKRFEVPHPKPPEQKRIVDILDQAFDGIATAKANAEKNLQNARALFESHLESVFTQHGDGWAEMPLGNVCELLNGFAFKRADAVSESQTQLVRMGNLYGNKLSLDRSPVFYPDSFAVDFHRYLLKDGDLILSLTGTFGKEDYGYTVRIPHCSHNLLMNQRIAKFDSVREALVIRDYLFYYLRSRAFLNILYPTANGTRQGNLSSVTIKTLPIPICSISEQRAIVEDADEMSESSQRLESIYQQKLAALEALKKSLLHQAFSGQL